MVVEGTFPHFIDTIYLMCKHLKTCPCKVKFTLYKYEIDIRQFILDLYVYYSSRKYLFHLKFDIASYCILID